MPLRELARTTNPVDVTYIRATLDEAGIPSFVFDGSMSVLDGSLGFLPQRIMVSDQDLDQARSLFAGENLVRE